VCSSDLYKLFQAIDEKRLREARLLVYAGADLNRACPEYKTMPGIQNDPIFFRVMSGGTYCDSKKRNKSLENLRMLLQLLKKMDDVKSNIEPIINNELLGTAPLEYAIRLDSMTLLKVFLQEVKSSLNIVRMIFLKKNSKGDTPLHEYNSSLSKLFLNTVENYPELIREMLETPNNKGRIPLMKRVNKEELSLLLEVGQKVNSKQLELKDNKGQTALDIILNVSKKHSYHCEDSINLLKT
jgi:hypothetical protein